MMSFSDRYQHAKRINQHNTEEQIIALTNGMWQGLCLAAGIKSIENRLFEDHQGYKGLQTLIHEATELCKRLNR